MWILPADLSGLHIALEEGPHLLPWHYVEEEVDRLAWLLRLTLKGIDGELRLDDATLKVLSDRKITAPKSLVVAVLRDRLLDLDETTERVRALGARCALLQLPEPQDMGYGWLEREVKAPLYRAIGTWVKRPEHPLAALNVQALPVMEAAALTTDPVELIEILESTLVHRMHYVDVGCEDDDYHRSLLLSAGKRLGGRLKRLDEASMGSPDRLRAAVDLVVSTENGAGDRTWYREGAQALDRVGLGRFVAGELSLGPLARQAAQSLALGALESELPEYAWSEQARNRLRVVHRARGAGSQAALVAVRGEAAPAMVDVPPPLDLLEEPIAQAFPSRDEANEALRALREIAAMPAHHAELPAGLTERLVRALRWLDDVANRSSVPERVVGQVLHGLLRLWSARGGSARQQEEVALKLLEGVLDQGSEPWIEHTVAVARMRSAVMTVRHPQAHEDLDRAEELVRRYRDVAGRLAREDAMLDVAAYLCLAEIALAREDYDRAHDCADKALHLTLRGDDSNGRAASLLSLARASKGQKRYIEAEQCARDALNLLEAIGDPARIGAALRVIAGILLSRHDGFSHQLYPQGLAEARTLSERALNMAEAIGDVEGRLESLLVLASIAIWTEQDDRLKTLASQAAALAEVTSALDLRAEAHFTMAISFDRLGDRDQAVGEARRALAILEQIGSASPAKSVRRFIDRRTKH